MFLQFVQKACSVKTIESYHDTLVNDLSKGENSPVGNGWSVSRMGRDFTWFIMHFKAFAELEEFMKETNALGFLPDVNAKLHGAAMAYWDASELALAGAMFQVRIIDNVKCLQPIAFVSKTFTDAAMQWHIYEKDNFTGFYTLKKFEHYLRGKVFVMETDNQNLVAMEKSAIPKVIRMREFMKSLPAWLRHISNRYHVRMGEIVQRK